MGASRVATRYLQAELGVGRTVFIDDSKIHRYMTSLLITEMTNAGKRGKRVRQLHVGLSYGTPDSRLDEITEEVVKIGRFSDIERYLSSLGSEVDVSGSVLRGVDVEPVGTQIRLENKALGVSITASPWEFQVHHDMPIGRTARQTTLYWPVKKQGAIVFYGWLKDNLQKASRMTIDELRDLWDSLGVEYDYH